MSKIFYDLDDMMPDDILVKINNKMWTLPGDLDLSSMLKIMKIGAALEGQGITATEAADGLSGIMDEFRSIFRPRHSEEELKGMQLSVIKMQRIVQLIQQVMNQQGQTSTDPIRLRRTMPAQ